MGDDELKRRLADAIDAVEDLRHDCTLEHDPVFTHRLWRAERQLRLARWALEAGSSVVVSERQTTWESHLAGRGLGGRETRNEEPMRASTQDASITAIHTNELPQWPEDRTQ